MRGITASKPVELLAQIAQFRLVRGDVHVAAQVVDGHDLVAARFRRFDQALVRIELGVAGEQGDLHWASFVCCAIRGTSGPDAQ